MTPRQQTIPERFGRRIRRERERRGWSMRDLGSKCGVNASTILRVEQGRDMALSSAVAVAGALGLGMDWLLAETHCGTCDGMPPAGFICSECGRKGETA